MDTDKSNMYIEETSKMSSLDLYEDLLINDTKDGTCLTLQELNLEKQQLKEQVSLLQQQLSQATSSIKTLAEQNMTLKENFTSLLQTAKLELERKNAVISRMSESSTTRKMNPDWKNKKSLAKQSLDKPSFKSVSLKGQRIDIVKDKLPSQPAVLQKSTNIKSPDEILPNHHVSRELDKSVSRNGESANDKINPSTNNSSKQQVFSKLTTQKFSESKLNKPVSESLYLKNKSKSAPSSEPTSHKDIIKHNNNNRSHTSHKSSRNGHHRRPKEDRVDHRSRSEKSNYRDDCRSSDDSYRLYKSRDKSLWTSKHKHNDGRKNTESHEQNIDSRSRHKNSSHHRYPGSTSLRSKEPAQSFLLPSAKEKNKKIDPRQKRRISPISFPSENLHNKRSSNPKDSSKHSERYSLRRGSSGNFQRTISQHTEEPSATLSKSQHNLPYHDRHSSPKVTKDTTRSTNQMSARIRSVKEADKLLNLIAKSSEENSFVTQPTNSTTAAKPAVLGEPRSSDSSKLTIDKHLCCKDNTQKDSTPIQNNLIDSNCHSGDNHFNSFGLDVYDMLDYDEESMQFQSLNNKSENLRYSAILPDEGNLNGPKTFEIQEEEKKNVGKMPCDSTSPMKKYNQVCKITSPKKNPHIVRSPTIQPTSKTPVSDSTYRSFEKHKNKNCVNKKISRNNGILLKKSPSFHNTLSPMSERRCSNSTENGKVGSANEVVEHSHVDNSKSEINVSSARPFASEARCENVKSFCTADAQHLKLCSTSSEHQLPISVTQAIPTNTCSNPATESPVLQNVTLRRSPRKRQHTNKRVHSISPVERKKKKTKERRKTSELKLLCSSESDEELNMSKTVKNLKVRCSLKKADCSHSSIIHEYNSDKQTTPRRSKRVYEATLKQNISLSFKSKKFEKRAASSPRAREEIEGKEVERNTLSPTTDASNLECQDVIVAGKNYDNPVSSFDTSDRKQKTIPDVTSDLQPLNDSKPEDVPERVSPISPKIKESSNSGLFDATSHVGHSLHKNTVPKDRFSQSFIVYYRNASLQYLLHLAKEALLSRNASSNESRAVWINSLEECQSRRKRNSRWLSEKEEVKVLENGTEPLSAPSAADVKPLLSTSIDLPSNSSMTSSHSWSFNDESLNNFLHIVNIAKVLTPLKSLKKHLPTPSLSDGNTVDMQYLQQACRKVLQSPLKK